MQTDPPPTDGRTFEFLGCIGTGGFGEVYLANMTTDSGLVRQVAVKLLHASVDADAIRRLRDEAKLLAALNHRAILQVVDLMVIGDRTALVTEYVEGEDLSKLVTPPGALPMRCGIEVIGEVAGALHAALMRPAPGSTSALGLVHRDLKPGNIRIARSGAVKLLDFGIAVSTEVGREAKTGVGVVIGTLGYLSPERIIQEGVRPPSDVYALGAVLYEVLVGEPLFDKATQQTILRLAMRSDEHDTFIEERFDRLPADVPLPARALLVRMLAYDEVDRPTAAEIERECDELAASLEGPHLRRWARDRVWLDAAFFDGTLVGKRLSGRHATSDGTARPRVGDSGVVTEGARPIRPTRPPGSGTGETAQTAAERGVASEGSAGGARPWLVAGAFVVLSGLAFVVLVGVGAWAVFGRNAEAPGGGGPSTPIDGVASPPDAPAGSAPGPSAAAQPDPPPAPSAEAVDAGGASPAAPAAPGPVAVVAAPPLKAQKPSPPPPGGATPSTPSTAAPAAPPSPPPRTETVTPEPAALRVGTRGDAVSVTATSAGETHTLPAALTPGSYRIRATFSTGELWTGVVDIRRAGEVDCTSARARCTYR